MLFGWSEDRALLAMEDAKFATVGERAACTSAQQELNASLPCATAFTAAYCVDGTRACSGSPDPNEALR